MSLTEEDFKCKICFQILFEPITLTCGHSYCRFCLADWSITSQKSNCPECREDWQYLPKVNVTLRNTVSSLFGNLVQRRKVSLINNENYNDTFTKFEYLKKENDEKVAIRRLGCLFASVLCNLVVAVFVIIFVGIQFFKGNSFNNMMSNSINDWSPEDVGYWFSQLGPWAKGTFDKKVIEAGIDGSLLIKLTDADLQDFKMSVALHRRTTLEAIKQLQIKLNRSQQLLEFMEQGSGLSTFIMYGLQQGPRGTLIYLYLFNYRDVFLPIFYCSVTLKSTNISCSQMQHSPTLGNWLEFLPLMFFFPYYLVGQLASFYLYINYWTSRVVIFHAILLTITDIYNMSFLPIICRSAHIYLGLLFFVGPINLITVVFTSLFIRLLVFILPVFVTDCIFYWLLYVSPFSSITLLLENVFAVCWTNIQRIFQRNAGPRQVSGRARPFLPI